MEVNVTLHCHTSKKAQEGTFIYYTEKERGASHKVVLRGEEGGTQKDFTTLLGPKRRNQSQAEYM